MIRWVCSPSEQQPREERTLGVWGAGGRVFQGVNLHKRSIVLDSCNVGPPGKLNNSRSIGVRAQPYSTAAGASVPASQRRLHASSIHLQPESERSCSAHSPNEHHERRFSSQGASTSCKGLSLHQSQGITPKLTPGKLPQCHMPKKILIFPLRHNWRWVYAREKVPGQLLVLSSLSEHLKFRYD